MDTSKILYNIKRVVINELDEKTGLEVVGSNPIFIKTAEEAKLKALISKGDEKILRTDDEILATASTPDLVYGYDLEFKDNKFSINFLSLVEGGKIRYDEKETSKIVGYDSPMMSDGYLSKPFKTSIYVEEKIGASVVGYVVFILNYCIGKAIDFEFKKGEFYSPTFAIEAKENTIAQKPVKSIDFVKELPKQVA